MRLTLPHAWDGERFRSIYGVPKQIFDELVEESKQHPALAGKQFYGDGVKGQFSKPLELKVAAVLEMCQAGLLFKSAERLYKISIPALQKFFHDFTYHQVKYEYAKHVYIPTAQDDIDRTLLKHSLFGFPGCITMFDGVKFGYSGCPLDAVEAEGGTVTEADRSDRFRQLRSPSRQGIQVATGCSRGESDLHHLA